MMHWPLRLWFNLRLCLAIASAARWVVLLLVTMLAACQSSPPPAPLPRIDELEHQRRVVVPSEQALTENRFRAIVTIHQWVIPLQRDTDQLWDMVDEAVADSDLLELWHRNGLRVGLLAGADLAAFHETAQSMGRMIRTRQMLSGQWESLVRSPQLHRRYTIYSQEQEDGSVAKVQVAGGHLQLLARSWQLTATGTGVQLMPHHHRPRTLLIPQDHREARLEGTFYDHLAMTLDPSGQWLVLGLYWPVPPSPLEEVEDPDEATDGTSDQAPDEAEQDEPAEPVEPSEDESTAGPEKDDQGQEPDAALQRMPDALEGEIQNPREQADAEPDAPAPGEGGDEPDPDSETQDQPPMQEMEPDTPAHGYAPLRLFEMLDFHLGRALWTGTRRGEPVQQLWILHIQPVQATTSPDISAGAP